MVTQITCSSDAGVNNSQNSATTAYNPIDGCLNTTATEALVQAHIDYTLNASNLAVYTMTNSLNGSTTITSRVGGSNGNLTITISSSVTGLIEDAGHSDSLVSGNLYNLASVTAGSSGAIQYSIQSVTLNAFGNTANALFVGTFPGGSAEAGSKTLFTGIRANLSIAGGNSNTNEANVQTKVRYSGTWSNLRTYTSANTLSVTTTIRSRIGAGNGTQVLSIATTVTGATQDTTHTDALVTTNLIDVTLVTPAGTGGITVVQNQSWIQTTNQVYQFSGCDDGGDSMQTTTTYFSSSGSTTSSTTTEAQAQLKIRGVKLTASELLMIVNVNSAGVSTTVTDRDNASNGSLTTTIGSNATGTFEDTTHSSSYAVGDLVNLKGANTAGTINVVTMGVQTSQAAISAVIVVD